MEIACAPFPDMLQKGSASVWSALFFQDDIISLKGFNIKLVDPSNNQFNIKLIDQLVNEFDIRLLNGEGEVC